VVPLSTPITTRPLAAGAAELGEVEVGVEALRDVVVQRRLAGEAAHPDGGQGADGGGVAASTHRFLERAGAQVDPAPLDAVVDLDEGVEVQLAELGPDLRGRVDADGVDAPVLGDAVAELDDVAPLVVDDGAEGVLEVAAPQVCLCICPWRLVCIQ